MCVPKFIQFYETFALKKIRENKDVKVRAKINRVKFVNIKSIKYGMLIKMKNIHSDTLDFKQLTKELLKIMDSPRSVVDMAFNTPVARPLLRREQQIYASPEARRLRAKVAKLETIIEMAQDILEKAMQLVQEITEDEEEAI